MFAAVALTAYLADLASKEWALRALADSDMAVLGDWFVLHLTFNPGAARRCHGGASASGRGARRSTASAARQRR